MRLSRLEEKVEDRVLVVDASDGEFADVDEPKGRLRVVEPTNPRGGRWITLALEQMEHDLELGSLELFAPASLETKLEDLRIVKRWPGAEDLDEVFGSDYEIERIQHCPRRSAQRIGLQLR